MIKTVRMMGPKVFAMALVYALTFGKYPNRAKLERAMEKRITSSPEPTSRG